MTDVNRIRVMIVEDDPDWRRGLAAYINSQPDMSTVAEADTAENALQRAGEVNPDVILLDIM
ncbi:response regulator, partial [Paenibacillus sepulcri]|nr:response regulator [Paenibacillus sepulcri]